MHCNVLRLYASLHPERCVSVCVRACVCVHMCHKHVLMTDWTVLLRLIRCNPSRDSGHGCQRNKPSWQRVGTDLRRPAIKQLPHSWEGERTTFPVRPYDLSEPPLDLSSTSAATRTQIGLITPSFSMTGNGSASAPKGAVPARPVPQAHPKDEDTLVQMAEHIPAGTRTPMCAHCSMVIRWEGGWGGWVGEIQSVS